MSDPILVAAVASAITIVLSLLLEVLPIVRIWWKQALPSDAKVYIFLGLSLLAALVVKFAPCAGIDFGLGILCTAIPITFKMVVDALIAGLVAFVANQAAFEAFWSKLNERLTGAA